MRVLSSLALKSCGESQINMTKDCRFLEEEFVNLRFEEQVNKIKIKRRPEIFLALRITSFYLSLRAFSFFLFLYYAISFKSSEG